MRYIKRDRQDWTTYHISIIEIDVSATDINITFNKSTMRMDTLSYKYYGDPNYGWLIMQANPQYGSLEFNIPDGSEIRIPYPLNNSLKDYQKSIDDYRKYYG